MLQNETNIAVFFLKIFYIVGNLTNNEVQIMTTSTSTIQNSQLPVTGFVRVWQIVGSKSKNIPALLPIGRTTFLDGVKSGRFPKPIRLGVRIVAWRVEDIREVITNLGN